jgi:hypothetical protein
MEEAEAPAPDGPLAQLDAAEKSADVIQATCAEVKEGLAASPADPVRAADSWVPFGSFARKVPQSRQPAPRAEWVCNAASCSCRYGDNAIHLTSCRCRLSARLSDPRLGGSG